MQTVRATVEFQITKGDGNKIVQLLNKDEVRKEIADHVAHVALPNLTELAELKPVGGFVHLHEHEMNGQCSTDKKEASAYLPGLE